MRASVNTVVLGLAAALAFEAIAQAQPEIFRVDASEVEQTVRLTGPTVELWGTIYMLPLGEFAGGEIVSVAASTHGTNTHAFAIEIVTMVALVASWTPNNAWLPAANASGPQGWTLMYPSGSGVGTPTHYYDRDRASHFRVPQLPAPTQLALHYRMRCRTTAALTGRETCLITPGMSSLSALVWRSAGGPQEVTELPQFTRPAAVDSHAQASAPPPRRRPRVEWREDYFGTPRRPPRTPRGWPP